MIKKILYLALLPFFLMMALTSLGSHIFGGELLYTHLSGNVYKVTLTVYGDCGANSDVFQTLYSAAPEVKVYNSAGLFATMKLKGAELGTEVSPICPAEINNTKCNGGTLPGVRKFVYADTVSLPVKSSKWAFIYQGVMYPATGAGRSGSITNVSGSTAGSPGVSTTIQLEADLDNTISDNSSPIYSTIPTPFYCVHVEEQYNHGGIDPDGDSLAFSLVPAVDGNTGSPVSYIAPFTPQNPLATDSGSFLFNALNGQVTFSPSKTQDALVVCQISEYRNGVLVGTSEREMTFVVLDNCQGKPPSLVVQNEAGGGITGKNIINVCSGTPHLSFDISVSDSDGDVTEIINSPPPGSATLTINNNNTTNPVIHFDWATGSIPNGIYTFYLGINNNFHCPLAIKQTIAYTINVVSLPTLSTSLLAPTQCIHQAYFQAYIDRGYLPRTVQVLQGGQVIKTFTDTTGIIADSIAAGEYTIIASSNPSCTITSLLNVTDSGKLPLAPVTASYCIGATKEPINITPIGTGAIITWYSATGTPMYYPPVPNTAVTGSDKWFFTEEYQYCMSDTIPVTAVVHPLPQAGAVIPETICYGDTVYLTGSGGIQYSWSPQNEILTDKNGKEYIRGLTPLNMKVVATDQYGCTDSAIIAYKDIQYCCKFSYPDAFTPNGDGKNDGFRIIPYGILTQYHLIIFNRWGQKVFETYDQGQVWDGTLNGIPCATGTYMYYFKGKCLTGNNEETKGDVILIR